MRGRDGRTRGGRRSSAVDEVNVSLARVEQVKKFKVLPEPFGIDTGELTPTMKIKRKVVAQQYAAR